jgi:glycosyltransferase involved in cell wall biosynthesis
MRPPTPRPAVAPAPTSPRVDIVVPVYNEQSALVGSIGRLHAFLSDGFPYPWRIVIADNASTDATLALAHRIAAERSRVAVLHLDDRGRGRALRAAWRGSDADVLAYMDVDLSTDLRALAPLVAGVASGHAELAIGTRLAPGSRVRRGARRELISRVYNRLLRIVLRVRFSDAQCGFKAIRADVAAQLLPVVADEGWFFDTELLVAAQRHGMRIHEVAVDWIDDSDSRVDIVSTALHDLRGVLRLRLAAAPGRGARHPTSPAGRGCTTTTGARCHPPTPSPRPSPTPRSPAATG